MRTSIESRADPLEADRARPADAQGGLSQRLSELQLLSSRDLRTEWRRLLRSNPPSLSRDLLVRALAYRVQELAHGGLPKATARKLATLAAELGREGPITSEARPQIKPGARLVREWRGRTHVVTVTEDGFAYAGKAYPSLTGIAWAITGARWSGPRFFGLVKRPTESGAKAPLHPATSEARHGQA